MPLPLAELYSRPVISLAGCVLPEWLGVPIRKTLLKYAIDVSPTEPAYFFIALVVFFW